MSASRTAVVTGASGAIGAAIAEALGAERFRVIVHYRNGRDSAEDVVNRITESGGWAAAIRADISRRDEVAALFAEVEHQCGSVDYLVNNAGITRDALLPFLSDEQWDEVIDTNLRGTYLCSQLAISGMMRLGGGAICNIVSPSGIRGQAGQGHNRIHESAFPRSGTLWRSRKCRLSGSDPDGYVREVHP
jgi:3-oxoacyl-[acyl-carrier protein] reductase